MEIDHDERPHPPTHHGRHQHPNRLTWPIARAYTRNRSSLDRGWLTIDTNIIPACTRTSRAWTYRQHSSRSVCNGADSPVDKERTLTIQVAAAQVRPRKADYQANLEMLGDLFEQLAESTTPTDLLTLPETVLSGYFLEGGVRDVARPADAVFEDILAVFRSRCVDPEAVLDVSLGFYEEYRGQYYNAALYATLTGSDHAACAARLHHVHRKFFLPTYGVFDEQRHVTRGRTITAFDTRLGRQALLICEDAWHSVSAALAALQGARIIHILSASPGTDFHGPTPGNLACWDRILQGIAVEHGVFVVYAGLVGFEGGKGFTGSSCIVDPWGKQLVAAPLLGPALVRAEIEADDVTIARTSMPLLSDLESALGDIAAHFHALAAREGPEEPRGRSDA